jgi:hypothetical protein
MTHTSTKVLISPFGQSERFVDLFMVQGAALEINAGSTPNALTPAK